MRILRIILASIVLTLFGAVAAEAQCTRAAIATGIGAAFPDQTAGAITPASTRSNLTTNFNCVVTLGDTNTLTAELITSASAALNAGLNLPQGTAPTSPVNGDLWTTSAGLFARIAGSTVGPFVASAGSVVTSIAGNTGAFTLGGLLTNSTNLLQVVAAAKSDEQAGTSAILATTPSQQQQHDSAIKAWANATPGRSPAVNSGYNVSSVTSASTGVYVFNFTTSFANANYVCHPGFITATVAFVATVTSQSVGSVTINVLTSAGGTTDPATAVTISCEGRQ